MKDKTFEMKKDKNEDNSANVTSLPRRKFIKKATWVVPLVLGASLPQRSAANYNPTCPFDPIECSNSESDICILCDAPKDICVECDAFDCIIGQDVKGRK